MSATFSVSAAPDFPAGLSPIFCKTQNSTATAMTPRRVATIIAPTTVVPMAC